MRHFAPTSWARASPSGAREAGRYFIAHARTHAQASRERYRRIRAMNQKIVCLRE
jgi:hypothetical protein